MMINTNKTKSGLNSNHKVLLHDQIQHGHVQAGHVEEEEKEFLFDKAIRNYELQKKILRIKLHEAENNFPQRDTEDRSFKGPWFRLLNFKDEAGVVRNFRYTYWQDGQYVFNGEELSCYLDGEKVKVGDVLVFWRHRRVKDQFFITIRRRSPAEQGGGVASSSVVQPSTCYDFIELLQRNERNSKPYSVGSVGSTSETEILVQQERVTNINGLVPSFGGPDGHHVRGKALDSEKVSIIDSSVDDHQYFAVAADNCFTTSSIATVPPWPFHKINNVKEVIDPTNDLEDLLNISDFDAIEDFLHPNYEGGDFTNYNHLADESPPAPDHSVIMEPRSNSDHTNPSNSHDEPFLHHYYKQYEIMDPGLDAQLRSRNCDPYAKRLVMKYIGLVMKKIFYSTTSVGHVVALDNRSEVERYMQPLRDLHLNLPVLEGLVALGHKHNQSEEAAQ